MARELILRKGAAQLVVEIDLATFSDLTGTLADAAADLDDLLLQRVALAREVRLPLGQRRVAVLLQDLPDLGQLFLALLFELDLHDADSVGELAPLLVADRGLNLNELLMGDLAPTPGAVVGFQCHFSSPCKSLFVLLRPSATLCQPKAPSKHPPERGRGRDGRRKRAETTIVRLYKWWS